MCYDYGFSSMSILIISDLRNQLARARDHADSPTSRQVTLDEHSTVSLSNLRPGNVALIMDVMGTAIKSDDTFLVTSYPAGTFKMITEFLDQGHLRLNGEWVIFHLSTNLVMEFNRSDTIGRIIKLCKVTKDKYPQIKIVFSTLMPRPIDHETTGRQYSGCKQKVLSG